MVIGGGPGGYTAAEEAASRFGLRTALIEAENLGGTCLNRGCIPTKTLLHTAGFFSAIREQGARMGLRGYETLDYDMRNLQVRKNEVIETLRQGIRLSLQKAKVDVYQGRGQIIDRGKVRLIFGEDQVRGCTQEELETDKILIASGMRPFLPPIPGIENRGVVTSDQLLDNEKKIDSLIIIGGGVIGLEFAFLYRELGTVVTVIEALDDFLSPFDRELSRSIKQQMKKKGISCHTSAPVRRIEKDPSGNPSLRVHFSEKGRDQEIDGEMVLVAAGRKPFWRDLLVGDADGHPVELAQTDKGYLRVDQSFETSVPGIYAAGDVIGRMELAHAAAAEGRAAVACMQGKKPDIDLYFVPSVVYTDPEIAQVGLTVKQAREKGLTAREAKYLMGANGKSVLTMQDRSFIKLVYEEGSQKILGASMMCAHASDLISQIAQALVAGTTLTRLAGVIFPHPSFAEAIGEACHQAESSSHA